MSYFYWTTAKLVTPTKCLHVAIIDKKQLVFNLIIMKYFDLVFLYQEKKNNRNSTLL